MALFAVEYTYAPEAAAVRDEFRPEHRGWLGAQHEAGRLQFVGPFADGSGAHLMITADDADSAREFLTGDPFARESAIAAVSVRELTQVYGPY
ncbi:YciI family protein [Gordonia neofelifaecis]|uniref:YCII-like protein n=1 Tax=Gordonia neofelifaecis NRRL B-59395 TaxID=644548 RepID=F1YMW1_9ACTN|nr:YciI family protein [Gordonia neofelifaecis]EGD54046.1 YCII-like protein [Gordonia neofelifaecis NRRL B-59395]